MGIPWEAGPAQLALALLLDTTGDPELPASLYQRFKAERVATWSGDVWAIDPVEIRAWVEAAE